MSDYSPEADVKTLESKIEAGLHSAEHHSPLGVYCDSEMATAFLNMFYTQHGFDVVRLPLMDCASSTDASMLLDKRWLEVMDKAQLLKNPLIIIEQTNCLPKHLLEYFYQKLEKGISIARQTHHVSRNERLDTANPITIDAIEMSSQCYVPLVVTCHNYNDKFFDDKFSDLGENNFMFLSEGHIYRVKSIKNRFVQMREEHDSLFMTPKNPGENSVKMAQQEYEMHQADKDIWNSVTNEHALEALDGHVGTHDNPVPHALQVPVSMCDDMAINQILFIDEVDSIPVPTKQTNHPEFQIAQHVNKPSVLSSENAKQNDEHGLSAHHKLLKMFNSFSHHLTKGSFSKFKP